jgi:protein TonB
MARDLFRDVAFRPPSVRSRRSPVVVVSIAAHALAVVGVLVATAIAPEILPTPRQALAFYEPARLIDIELPPPPPSTRPIAAPPDAPTVSPHAAPVVAPASIVPESWAPATERAGDGVVSGVESSLGTNIVGVPEALPPAPAVTTPIDPVRLHSGIKPPEKTVNVPPVYPELARAAQVEGIVILEAVIDASGAVTSARVLRGHPMLDQSALDAVQRWKFTPARLNDEVIPVVMTVTVRFTLR